MKLSRHNTSKFAFVLPAVLILSAAAAGALHAEPVATLKDVQGEVMIEPAGSPGTWNPAAGETPLNYGDSVKTGPGATCAVVYGDEADIRLEPDTTITIGEESDTQDILLKLGNLRTKINHDKAKKPFQFVTPVAVSAVRGTEVNFGFNAAGELTVELEDGSLYVFNDTQEMDLTLAGNKKIKILYDPGTGNLTVENDPSSDGTVEFSVGGETYTVDPGDSVTVETETAGGGEDPDTETDTGGPGGETTGEGDDPPGTPLTPPEDVSPVT